MGIGTLRQYHNRQSNSTTIKDILGEVTHKTAFVAADEAVAAQKLAEESGQIRPNPATKAAEAVKTAEPSFAHTDEINAQIAKRAAENVDRDLREKLGAEPIKLAEKIKDTSKTVTDIQRFDNESPAVPAKPAKPAFPPTPTKPKA